MACDDQNGPLLNLYAGRIEAKQNHTLGDLFVSKVTKIVSHLPTFYKN